uniref:Cytochrome b561 domain-containing protein n=1 Tax=Magallana gigas TaxID=29159 RepID=A0A8W8NHS3_MAGGI
MNCSLEKPYRTTFGNSTSANQAAAGECVPILTFFLLAHGLLMFFSFIGFVLGIVSFQFDHFKLAHGAIGLIVMLLGISQPFNVLARPRLPSEGEKTPFKRRILELFHHNIRRVAVALALINISLGVFLALAVWALWFVFLIVVILVFVFFELLKIQVVHEKMAAILPLKTKEYPVSNEQKMENVAKADDSQQGET